MRIHMLPAHIIYDFTIADILYKNISDCARINHTSIQSEIETRLRATLNENYRLHFIS